MKVYDVNNELAEVQVREDIRKQNFDLSKEDFDKEFKLIYKIGDRTQESVHRVVEVSPVIQKQLLDAAGRLCIGLRACKAVYHLMVSKCYRC